MIVLKFWVFLYLEILLICYIKIHVVRSSCCSIFVQQITHCNECSEKTFFFSKIKLINTILTKYSMTYQGDTSKSLREITSLERICLIWFKYIQYFSRLYPILPLCSFKKCDQCSTPTHVPHLYTWFLLF